MFPRNGSIRCRRSGCRIRSRRSSLARAAPDRGDPAVRRSRSGGPARLRALRDERRVGRRALRPPRRASARARACRRALQRALAARAARASGLEARSPAGGAGLRGDRAPVDAPRGDRVELRAPRPRTAAALHEPRASSSAGSRWAPPSSSPSSPTSTSWRAVESLLRNNLLTTERRAGDEPRLGMLETIREYALERLAARGDGDAVRRRHAEYYLALAEEAEPGLLGPQQREWLERLDAERDNIRAALTWAVDAGEADVGLRIGAALWRFWQLRSLEQEGRERLQELLALGSGSPATRAKAQTMVAVAGAHPGRPRDGPTDARGEPPGASPSTAMPAWSRTRSGFSVGQLSLAGETDSALALTREAHEVARGGASPYIESARTLASRRVSRGARGARRCRADDRGGRRPGTEARKCPERRRVEEVTRGHRVDARRSRTAAAAVRREPRHPPEPGRRTGCLALSRPTSPFSRSRRVT